MRINWFFIFIGVLFLVMLAISAKYFRSAVHSSVGIAYAREFRINADRAAYVQHIHAVAGQQVKAGDLLVELASSELDIELDKLQSRIITLQSERIEKAKLTQAKIAFVKAEQGVEIEKINSSIVQLESELELNKKLTAEFSNEKEQSDGDNPIRKKIDALKLQRKRYEEAIAIKITDIRQEVATEEKLLDNQVRLLEREHELMKTEQSNLRKVASVDGVVESVLVKEGEQVDAFTALLSVNPIHPTTVIGYVVGRKQILPVGTEVTVRAQDNKEIATTGKVIGYGSVVALPDILQKATAVTAFGREFFIEVPAQNGFANGERVLIR